MFEEILSKNEKNALALLGQSKLLKNVYMAGGTALALQIGHRFSYDFDFFTQKEFDENMMLQRIKELIPEFKLERVEWRTILGYIQESRFSLFFYSYPLLFKTHKFLGADIADIRDIAAMKIAAISDRNTKKDFIDLYFIIEAEKILSLKDALKLYDEKFKALKQNQVHILKSLQYFDDAEKEAMPKMIKSVSWQNVKNYFQKEVKNSSKELL
ncbi:MAG: nucleotidyl transferase AbiEii/AbiGii toxin family protein [Minisyncoccia bacterium]